MIKLDLLKPLEFGLDPQISRLDLRVSRQLAEQWQHRTESLLYGQLYYEQYLRSPLDTQLQLQLYNQHVRQLRSQTAEQCRRRYDSCQLILHDFVRFRGDRLYRLVSGQVDRQLGTQLGTRFSDPIFYRLYQQLSDQLEKQHAVAAGKSGGA